LCTYLWGIPMDRVTTNYEYRILSGQSPKLDSLEQELNKLADEGWEVHQSVASAAGGFGFGMAVGSGAGGGGLLTSLVLILRRPKTSEETTTLEN
jgi:hypothetical protein